MKYDRTNPLSIELYGKGLIDHSFIDILEKQVTTPEERQEFEAHYGNPRRKGGLGNFLEEVYFDYKANSDSRPDFHEAGVELKVTPFEINKKGEYRAGERLVLTMIDYQHPVEPDLFSSHLWEKIANILLVYYQRIEEATCNLDYIIRFVSLFSPSEEDLVIILQDYQKIIQTVMEGRAHELTESNTLYLAACTKGATAEKSLATQFYNPDCKAKKRAFSFKQSYMHSVLDGLRKKSKEESILANTKISQGQTFEEHTLELIHQYIGMSDQELCQKLECKYSKNKAQWSTLAYRMLGISSNTAEEFKKANVVVKTVRLEEDGSMRENMSLPTICFKKLILEEWEESTLRNYFEETRFLFVVYGRKGEHYILKNAKYWNMPLSDLDGDLKSCWEATIKIVKEGVVFTKRKDVIYNNLPSVRDNRISHIRPHAKQRYYDLKDGTKLGNSIADGDQLPDGQWMTKQCFWLNNTYILESILSD